MGCSLRAGVVGVLLREEDDAFDFTVLLFTPSSSGCVSRFSLDFGALRSNAPGVFGVLAEPKEANAPDPKPKADEAPAEGDGAFVVRGKITLKGFDRP